MKNTLAVFALVEMIIASVEILVLFCIMVQYKKNEGEKNYLRRERSKLAADKREFRDFVISGRKSFRQRAEQLQKMQNTLNKEEQLIYVPDYPNDEVV